MFSPEHKSPHRQTGFSLLEFMMVAVIIGILIVTAYRYLNDHIIEAEKAALRSISRDFASSMAMLRNKWIIEGRKTTHKGHRTVKLDQYTLYLNKNGWPISGSPLKSETLQNVEHCTQLWGAIMQYGVTASMEGQQNQSDAAYHISLPSAGTCRYQLARLPDTEFYFDYQTVNGEVKLSTE